MLAFAPWARLTDTEDVTTIARRAIAAAEELFNTFPIQVTNMRGLNDNLALGSPTSFIGHCTSCHDTPNVGNHSLPLPLDIGTAHTTLSGMEMDSVIAAALAQLSMPGLAHAMQLTRMRLRL